MTLSQSHLDRINYLLGYNVRSPEELIHRIKQSTAITVQGADIPLADGLRVRLKSRAGSQWGQEWIKTTVTRLLHDYVGW